MIEWEKEWETIKQLISDGVPYDKIGEKYNCTGAYIRKRAKQSGMELPKRRKINPKETFNKDTGKKCLNCGKPLHTCWRTFCSDECRQEYQYENSVKNWKNGNYSGCDKNGDPREFLRKYLMEKNNCKCEKCGYDKENPYTGKSILQIHHIDGDCFNNKEENLQLLCPNCHALTENFGSRNKNATRVLWNNKTKTNNGAIV